MENKYYTPEIEEFHLGFECQTLDQNSKWIDQIFTDINFNRFTNKHLFRVKFLDEKDIESLGWVNGSNYGLSAFVLNYGDNNNEFQMYFHDENLIMVYNFSGIIFQGYIKNRSEFKKLMQQLNIK